VILATVFTFSALYAPQPLLPILSKNFNVNVSHVALVTTVTLIPLSFSPFVYGILLESISAKTILFYSFLLLGVSEFFIFLTTNFSFLLLIRLFQGLLIPAVLTSLMTYVSKSFENNNLQKAMSIYIAATIVGGYLGRAVSGLVSFMFGWRTVFLMLGIFLCIFVFFIKYLERDIVLQTHNKNNFRELLTVLKNKTYLAVYLVIFFTFFIFAGFLNFLPDRLSNISYTNELKIGLAYSGYLMGVLISLFSNRIVGKIGHKKAMVIGSLCYILAISFFYIKNVYIIYVNMFLFCGCMFLIHSVASGYVNSISRDKKGIVNGLYISFYYTGGIFGTYLPGLIYDYFGWNAFLSFLLVFCFVTFMLLLLKLKETKK